MRTRFQAGVSPGSEAHTTASATMLLLAIPGLRRPSLHCRCVCAREVVSAVARRPLEPATGHMVTLVPYCGGIHHRAATFKGPHDSAHHRRLFLQGGALCTASHAPFSSRHRGPTCEPYVPTPWHPEGHRFRSWTTVHLSDLAVLLDAKGSVSSGYHPQSNGQDERMN